MDSGDAAARRILNDVIARHTRRLEQIALEHQARALAEAAESNSRLAFDPGPAADKVRRYEDAAIRRMTRACDDLAKLRRSGMLDEDAPQETELPDLAREPEPRPARNSSDDIVAPASAATKPEISTGCDAPPPSSERSADGLRSWVRGERPAKRETANIEPGAWVDQSPSPADVQPISEMTADAIRALFEAQWPAKRETANIEAALAPQESACPATAQPSKPTAGSARSNFQGNIGLWILLPLVACCWWFAAGGRSAALRASPVSPSFSRLATGSSPVATSPAHAGPAATEMRIEPSSDHQHRTMKSEAISEDHHAERDDYIAGDKRCLAGVEPAAAGEPPALRPRI